MMKKQLLGILLFLFPVFVTAQTLKSPSEFLGYELGTQFTFHHQVIDYVNYVAQQSNRVIISKIGETYEGRPLVLLTITSPNNQANLESIRLNNLKRSRFEAGAANPNLPVIVWLSYNVHGNEAASTEAAMQTLYELASTQDPNKTAWLEQVVVQLDPCLNPDGRDRYVTWYRQTVGSQSNPDPNAREHQFQWASGRTNHYYFDMNRDWAWLTQKESRARVTEYQKWMPQIHVDFHEQGFNEPYYFAPAAEPVHEAITAFQKSFQVEIGKNHASYFDKNAWLFFTRQRFDLFYPSYGDTWPMFNGAIGMTYEQGGINAGLQILTERETILSLKDRIAHHFTTGISTIETAVNGKHALLREYEAYFKRSVENPEGAFKSYILKNTNPESLDAFLQFLSKQGITYEQMPEGKVVSGYDYFKDDSDRYKTQAGDILVSAYQTKSTLLRVLFDPKPALSDSITYDITSWALPWVFGVETLASNQRLSGSVYTKKPNYTPISGEKNAQAFIFKWDSFADATFLSQLIQQGFKTRTTELELKVGSQLFNAGSILILRADNIKNEHFLDDLDQLAEKNDMPLVAVSSGYGENGIDLGSSDIHFLTAPRIAVVSGEETESSNLGEIWYFFNQDLNYPASLIDAKSIGYADLSNYNVLILPNGSYNDVFTDAASTKIKEWVKNGGNIIAFTGATSWLANHSGLSELKAKKEPKPDSAKVEFYGDRERTYISSSNPGAFFKVNIDKTHPLGFGLGNGFFSLRLQDSNYELLKNGWNVATISGKEPISGFVGVKAKAEIKKSLVFGTESLGKGQLIYFTENPLFRAFLYQNKLAVANALFQVGQTR